MCQVMFCSVSICQKVYCMSMYVHVYVCIFTGWAGRWCPWHGAVGQPVWQSAADADHWLYPEEPRSARPSGSLATP